MGRLAYHIAAVYRVKSYIVIATFVALLITLGVAWGGDDFARRDLQKGDAEQGDAEQDKTPVSFHHTALVILDFYLPILAAIGAGVFKGRGAEAAALQANRHETEIANLYSVLLFSFVLGAPPVAYFFGDAREVNNWIVGSAAALSSLLLTGVGYYFGAAEEATRSHAPNSSPQPAPAAKPPGVGKRKESGTKR